MDIFNRPPAIPEDTLQYTLYPSQAQSDKASVTTLAACILARAGELLPPKFIWHRDAFELKVVRDEDASDEHWILEGRMRVGDCVDDEWCVVWLLKEVSKLWDIAISIVDSDGEFLLIEAADVLPSWVKPTNTENRVWIYSSHLQLVPLQYTSPPSRRPRKKRRLPGASGSDGEDVEMDDENWISAHDALNLVRDSTVDTLASKAVEDTVWARISGYPEAALEHVHTAKVFVPVDIARALSVEPSLVQKPVETFYTRDAIQLRAAHRMTRFPPDSSILRNITLTRTAYAQLVGQKFAPPKAFGRWKEREGTPQWRWRDVGMKIASGFEMLYQESKGRTEYLNRTADGVDASAAALKDSLRQRSDYKAYISTLVSAGYFKGEIEGSQKWNALEDKAASVFVEARREDDSTRPSFAALVNAAIARADPALGPSPESEREDSDTWLNVDAEDFDDMLERTLGGKQEKREGAEASDAMNVDGDENKNVDDASKAAEERTSRQAERLQDLAKKVGDFVEGEGDLEGAKFADEGSSGDELSDEEFSDDDRMFDSDDSDDSAVDSRNAAARQEAMDRLIPALDASEYGQMPASFHRNSQRVAPSTLETEAAEVLGPSKPPPSDSSTTPQSKPIRAPILPRDKYDGVDSDDETDEEEDPAVGPGEDEEEEEEDRPQVVGEVEVDMGAEEEEFLEFSRQALGISDQEWGAIMQDRKDRGVFVPLSAKTDSATPAKSQQAPTAADSAKAFEPQMRTPSPGPRPNANPNLDSFEAVMQAMDAELAARKGDSKQVNGEGKGKAKASSVNSPPPAPSASKGKGKATVTIEEENESEDEDIEAAMDAELRAALERGGELLDDDDVDGMGEAPMDYNLIKNFLESFKSQGGLAGPVGNLAGRLQPGWQMPRDES